MGWESLFIGCNAKGMAYGSGMVWKRVLARDLDPIGGLGLENGRQGSPQMDSDPRAGHGAFA